MSQGSAILLDRVQVTTLLKDTQKNRLNLDDEQLRGVYLRLVPVNEDPDPEKGDADNKLAELFFSKMFCSSADL